MNILLYDLGLILVLLAGFGLLLKRTNLLLTSILKELQKEVLTPPPAKITVSTTSPPKPHKNLCQILKQADGKMTLVGWVRKDSTAWRKIYNARGLYLKNPDGTIEEGIQ